MNYFILFAVICCCTVLVVIKFTNYLIVRGKRKYLKSVYEA